MSICNLVCTTCVQLRLHMLVDMIAAASAYCVPVRLSRRHAFVHELKVCGAQCVCKTTRKHGWVASVCAITLSWQEIGVGGACACIRSQRVASDTARAVGQHVCVRVPIGSENTFCCCMYTGTALMVCVASGRACTDPVVTV